MQKILLGELINKIRQDQNKLEILKDIFLNKMPMILFVRNTGLQDNCLQNSQTIIRFACYPVALRIRWKAIHTKLFIYVEYRHYLRFFKKIFYQEKLSNLRDMN